MAMWYAAELSSVYWLEGVARLRTETILADYRPEAAFIIWPFSLSFHVAAVLGRNLTFAEV
jgi:hypothetical protein